MIESPGFPSPRRRAGPHALAVALVAAVGALACAPFALAGETLPGPVRATVLDVVDGDTLTVRARIWLGQVVEVRVRLAGVDAPELRGACGREKALANRARAFVTARIGDQEVTLRDVHYGKYAGRVLARVETADGEDLGATLAAAGLARAYAGGRREEWCPAAAARR